ncbi:MAG: hypothetical protein H7Z10_13440, partial [Gemmatimonadaceae bacterium]|nr:hypothetical protein [Acetobacteraceae bacterium]
LLQIESGDHRAALATLAASDAPDLPGNAMEQRTLAAARAQAGLGDAKAATALLVTLGTAAADELRATLLHAAGDWTGAVAALSDLAAKALPPEGLLTEPMQDIVLRQATSAVQANDVALLADLRRRHATRLSGTRAELFRLLTADQLRSPADLPRAASELALARLVPNGPAGRGSVMK